MTQTIQPDTGTANGRISLITFRLGSQVYALPVTDVIQIIEMVALTPLPQATAAMPGALNYRGNIVPTLDLRLHFGLPFQPYSLHTHIILVDGGEQPLGLVVDEVESALEISGAELQDGRKAITAFAHIAPNGRAANYISSLVKINRRIIPLIAANTLLAPDPLSALNGDAPA